jgi:cell division protein ZapB
MNSQSESVSSESVSKDASKTLIQEQVERLEVTVTELVSLCKKLSEENNTYKGSNQQLLLERSDLQSKNDKVRGQVEAMVNRLKAMDKAS